MYVTENEKSVFVERSGGPPELSPRETNQQLIVTPVLSGTGTVLRVRLTYPQTDTGMLFGVP